MRIQGISLWKDTGYTEGAVKVPSPASSLPDPDITVDLAIPSRDWPTVISLPIPYTDLLDMTYIGFDMVMSGGQSQHFYGWVDEVTMGADTKSVMTSVSWHMDLWRMWIASATFTSGMVMRRAPVGQLPPQPYPYRYRMPSTVVEIPPFNSSTLKIYWVYLRVVTTEDAVSTVNTWVIPISPDMPAFRVGEKLTTNTNTTPSYGNALTGSWDESLGIDPKSVKSAFISQYPPNTFTVFDDNLITMDNWVPHQPGNARWVLREQYTSKLSKSCREFITDMSATTTDTAEVAVTGWDNEVVGALPWGVPVSGFGVRTILGTESSYVQIRGIVSGDTSEAHASGVCFTIPMVAFDVTDNAFSAYMYSGAREADRRQMVTNAEIQRHQSMQSTLMSAGSGAASGAIGGAMVAGPLGLIAGAVAGGLGTAITGSISSQLTYNYMSGEAADKMIAVSDYRAANQTNGLTVSGATDDYLSFGAPIKVVTLVNDEYSRAVRDDDMRTYGAHVCEPEADCSALIRAGGPLQIADLIVGGPVPTAARKYIAERFAGGVIID